MRQKKYSNYSSYKKNHSEDIYFDAIDSSDY